MLYLFINLVIKPLEAEKLAISRWAEMCKLCSLRWVPSMEALHSRACLNYVGSADSISNKFCSLEKGPQNSFQFYSWFSTLRFNVATEGLDHDACLTCVPVCASAWSKIFILSLTVGYLGFPLLAICYEICLSP
jgi:hypothetical protein